MFRLSNCAIFPLLTQSRLCQLVTNWNFGMLKISLGTCRTDLWPQLCKMIKNDTIAIVSTWEILKNWYVQYDPRDSYKWFGTPNLRIDLFWHNCGCVKQHQNDKISIGPSRSSLLESKYVSTSQIGAQLVSQKINYSAQDSEWHNLGILINFCWTNLNQSCFGGCTDYADHNPNLKCVNCFYVTQSWLCHKRATREIFVVHKLTSQLESPNTDKIGFKCLSTYALNFLWSNEVQIAPKFKLLPHRACKSGL